MSDELRKTVFLDRDGVINQVAAPHDYIKTWDEFHFLPRAEEAIRCLNEHDFLVIIVSNQRGIARGMMTTESLADLHNHMQKALADVGAHIDAIYICPHEKGTCHCRKPEIGLFLQAEAQYPINKARSYMVGDSSTDIEAGKNYGIKTIAINKKSFGADFRCKDLMEATKWILKEEEE